MSENAEKTAKWYVVHTYSGYENKVKVTLEKSIVNNGFEDRIQKVEIPMETVIEIKNNKRKPVERKIMPSYVLVYMIMDEDTWYLVRNTRGVTGFVGAGNKPQPLSEADYNAIYAAVEKFSGDIAVGDTVKLLTGTMTGQIGTVKEIDLEKNIARIVVSMFNQDTEVELPYDEIVKAD